MSAQHTPGPWKIDPDKRPGMEWNRHIDAEGLTICFMSNSNGMHPERDLANARLIAAAPELLEALDRIAMIYENPEPPSLHELSARAYDMRCIARAAIAKAKGGNQ